MEDFWKDTVTFPPPIGESIQVAVVDITGAHSVRCGVVSKDGVFVFLRSNVDASAFYASSVDLFVPVAWRELSTFDEIDDMPKNPPY